MVGKLFGVVFVVQQMINIESIIVLYRPRGTRKEWEEWALKRKEVNIYLSPDVR